MLGTWDEIRASVPDLLSTVAELHTVERLITALGPIADTPGPSQLSSTTRGAVVAQILGEFAPSGGTAPDLARDVEGTGCDLVHSGAGGPLVVAHLDEISYLIAGDAADHDGWPVQPFCYHLATGSRPAGVIRVLDEGRVEQVGAGRICGPPDRIRYHLLEGDRPRPGDRVVLRSPLDIDPASGRVTGSLDNAAGVAAALLAAVSLHELGLPAMVALTDEEEGPAGASTQTMARGAARLLPQLPTPPLTTVVDVHGPRQPHRGPEMHTGASLAEFTSAGRGAVTPPLLFHAVRTLLDEAGVCAPTNTTGHVPRSDDVVATLRDPRVCILGYPGTNRHFDHGLPTANVYDLLDLATSLVVVSAAAAVHSVD